MKPTLLSLALLTAQALPAAWADFRAEAVQTAPNGQAMSAKIAVGKQAMRSEYQHNGETVIQLVDMKTGQQTLIFPARKAYVQGPPGLPPQGKRTSPCEGLPGAQCVEQGRETVHGRSAVKWQVTVPIQGQALTSTQWLDAERGLPLRMLGPHGEQTEMRLLGKETLLGREVEKWEVSSRLPNGQTYTGRQWYDPKLDTLLREELPDGSVRELKHLDTADLPAELFAIPAGFQRLQPPAGPR